MRFFSALKTDLRYQIKYGFYLLYAFFSVVYIAALIFIPAPYKGAAASAIILTDPVMLGIFFIGGIWLLEKSEGLHSFWGITPLRGEEYVLAKAISLSVISTLSAFLITLLGFRGMCNYFLLVVSVFFGSMIFTIAGLLLATRARSLNQYMLIATPPAVILIAPALLVVFGLSHPFFEIMPGTALWRIIAYTLGVTDSLSLWPWLALAGWLGIVLLLAIKRIPVAMLAEGGGKV